MAEGRRHAIIGYGDKLIALHKEGIARIAGLEASTDQREHAGEQHAKSEPQPNSGDRKEGESHTVAEGECVPGE